MMKRTLFKSESRTAGRVPSVAAALLLSLSAGCVSQVSRESAAPAGVAAGADVAAADVRRVQVSGDGAEPSIAAAADGSVYVTWVAHRPDKEADVWLLRFDREGMPVGGGV